MAVDAILGLQWGDEGKGKIVDFIARQYQAIARFQGGPNAGHTLKFNNITHVLHQIPSGIFRDGIDNVIGNGVVIDPIVFKKEIQAIKKIEPNVIDKLYISDKAHIIIPTHKALDYVFEKKKGDKKIGSTQKGIGPTYTDKISRVGLRMGDLKDDDFLEKYKKHVSIHESILDNYNFNKSLKKQHDEFFEAVQFLNDFKIIDTVYFLNEKINNNENILAEGAQGSLLDIDFGSYPFVTSSNTTIAGVCSGLGVPPQSINATKGIFKAYCTRVGGGPFPTELNNEIGTQIQSLGNEIGATTGRQRRCGWLDIPALKYAIMINGVTELYMMKADVLNTFDNIKICTHYEIDGHKTDKIPFDFQKYESIKPIYKNFSGWNSDTTNLSKAEQLPKNLVEYIKFIEETTQIPIKIVSLGPHRNQTIFL